jgi:branched-chain amino acid transport system substrate-binding protein
LTEITGQSTLLPAVAGSMSTGGCLQSSDGEWKMLICTETAPRRASQVDEHGKLFRVANSVPPVRAGAKNSARFGLAALALLAWSIMPAAADDVIRFGAAVSLTGPLSTEAKQMKDGYDFYVKQINERGGIEVGGKKYQVAIVYYDDGSNPETAAKLTEKLLTEDKVDFLLGPYGSGPTLTASTVAEKHQVPMVVAHAASPQIYDRGYKYIFGTLTLIDQYFGSILDMASKIQPKPQTVAIIAENALFPQAAATAGAKKAEELGFKLVYNEKYPTGIKDMSSNLAAVRQQNPDILLAAGYTPDMILLVRQIHEMEVKPKMLGFALGPSLPTWIPTLHQEAEGTIEPIQWAPSMHWKDQLFGWTAQDYADLYKKEFGYVPDYHPPQSTAALEVYQAALQKAGTLDPQKVRDAIAAANLMTAYGPIKFDERGVNIAKGMAVMQIQHGERFVVYPPDEATGKLLYPLPN